LSSTKTELGGDLEVPVTSVDCTTWSKLHHIFIFCQDIAGRVFYTALDASSAAVRQNCHIRPQHCSPHTPSKRTRHSL